MQRAVTLVTWRLLAAFLSLVLVSGLAWGVPVRDESSKHPQKEAARWPHLCAKICRPWDVLCLSDCSRLMPPNYGVGSKRSALPFDDKLGNLSFDDYMFLKMVGRL